MFSLSVVDTDAFLEMPVTSRLLYYELGIRADDDGFVGNWKKILRMASLSEDDMKVLIAKKFIIPFESGVIVIRHWKLNNYLRNDRHTPTVYQDEFQTLQLENNVYEVENAEKTTMLPVGIPMVYTGKDSIDKDSIDKDNINNTLSETKVSTSDVAKASKRKYGEYKHVLLKDEELQALKRDYANWEELITYLDEYIEMKGYKAKSHYLCIRKWVVNAVKEQKKRQGTDDGWDEFKRMMQERGET